MDKVSCLMITLNRFERFKESFECYCNQDYPDKELIIVSDGSQNYLETISEYISDSGRTDIKTFFLGTRKPLGYLRNVSIQKASGTLICQWDDDDLNHPQRLTTQIKHMQQEEAQASYLLDNFHLFMSQRQLYWCDWVRMSGSRGKPGTLLAYKSVLPNYDDEMAKHEDTRLQEELYDSPALVKTLSDHGYLFMYTYHEKNVHTSMHHKTIAVTLSMEFCSLKEHIATIWNSLSCYPISPPITVMGHRGEEVFVWTGDPYPDVQG